MVKSIFYYPYYFFRALTLELGREDFQIGPIIHNWTTFPHSPFPNEGGGGGGYSTVKVVTKKAFPQKLEQGDSVLVSKLCHFYIIFHFRVQTNIWNDSLFQGYPLVLL